MAKLFKFEIYTPYRLFFSGPVETVILKLIDGEIGILAGHSLITAPVVCSAVRIKDKEGKWKTAFTAEGILEVKKSKTVLVSDAAEWPEEIDIERAQASKKDAASVIKDSAFKFENASALKKLKRAETRLAIALQTHLFLPV